MSSSVVPKPLALPSVAAPSPRAARIAFDQPRQAWDGFGFNYVETCQTRDYGRDPQDYGGLAGLTDGERERVFEAVFGRDGLRPNVMKLFLDPWHQAGPGAAFDHRGTTAQMRRFAREGAARMEAQGEPFSVVTTLYGPPAWMTLQRTLRGRDMDPAHTGALVTYLVDWIRFLREEERLAVRAVSLHNEGEDWSRWPENGVWPGDDGHDYNLYWTPAQVVAFMPLLRRALDEAGLHEVAVAPGETTNWRRFEEWGYADAIAEDAAALAALGLITSHGFHAPSVGRWSADYRSAGTDRLRARKPELHAWTTSTGWGTRHLGLLWEIQQSVTSAKINAFIPWAGLQKADLWVGGDPNPHTAISVVEGGRARFNKEYFVYRHACRIGRAGARVAPVAMNDSEVVALAFTGGPSGDGCVFANLGDEDKPMRVEFAGPERVFDGALTDQKRDWVELGETRLPGAFVLPAQSAVSFVERP